MSIDEWGPLVLAVLSLVAAGVAFWAYAAPGREILCFGAGVTSLALAGMFTAAIET